MPDFSTFSEQYPDPDKQQILRIIEEMKIAVIKQFLLLTEPGTTKLLRIKESHSSRAIENYMAAYECVHVQVIPTFQGLTPQQFSPLIKKELTNWILFPNFKTSKPP